MLSVKNITVKANDKTLLDNLSFEVKEGQWLMIIGPNGAGKSTAVNAVSGALPYTGTAEFMGKELKKMTPSQRAQCIGVLSQSHNVGYDFTVEEIVNLGRYSRTKWLSEKNTSNNELAVDNALSLCGLSGLKKRSALTLSGGELQRCFLAQVFAQDPKVLLLDEPANHLDLVYLKQIFSLISDWLKTPGRAMVSVVHDLSLAKLYGTHALLLDNANTVAYGNINQVMTKQNLDKVYGIDVSQWMKTLLSNWQ